MKRFIYGFFLLFLVLVSQVSASNKAMIIFDASGSMWGQIDGKAKITIARDALKDVVKGWNENIELGLTVYGHRKKSDCSDIETLIPIGKVNKSNMISKVSKIMPKGKTPIAKSLRQVADKLRGNEDETTIILISDGKESCDADPCGTAKQLKAEGIKFVAHVVGFNVDKSTDKQLQCIADATGGEYFSAKNATALNKAIKSITKKVEKPKPKVKKLDHNIEVTASEIEGGKWVSASHYIYEDEGGKAGERAGYVSSSKKKVGKDTLPIGKYILKSSYNDFEKLTPFEIKAGKVTKVHIIMGSTGTVEVTASETDGGKWVRASHYIYEDEGGKAGERAGYVSSSKKKVGKDTLPVGKYILKSSYNDFEKLTPFEIKAGKTTKVHVVMGQTGIVETSASETEGGKWVDAAHYIYQDEDGKIGGRVTGASSRKKKVGHEQIPVGKYILKSSYNDFEKLTPFEIKAGKVTKIHVIFSPFFISAKCTNANAKVTYEVYASNGQMVDDKKIKCSDTWKITLDDGDYSVEATIEAGKGEAKFTVGAGKPNKLILDLTNLNHKGEIKADSAEKAVVVPVTPKKVESKKEQKQQTNIEKVKINGLNQKDLEEAGKALNALGALFGSVTKEQQSKNQESDKKADKEFEEMSKSLDMFSK